MSLQNKYKRTPKERPQKKGSSEVVSQIVNNDEKNKKINLEKQKKQHFYGMNLYIKNCVSMLQ